MRSPIWAGIWSLGLAWSARAGAVIDSKQVIDHVPLDATEAAGCLRDLRAAPVELWDGEEQLPATLEWAHRLDHAVYDCA